MQLLLASTSPRRKQLLETLGIPFTVVPSEYEEVMDQTKDAKELVTELSLGKAQAVAKKYPDALVIAADTFVVFEKKYLGKPKDRDDAKRMLTMLSGKVHEVITGFTIIDGVRKATVSDVVVTKIYFKPLSEKDIEEYLNKNTYGDKAGAYAIQEVEEFWIEKIEGDRDSAIGLPIAMIAPYLK